MPMLSMYRAKAVGKAELNRFLLQNSFFEKLRELFLILNRPGAGTATAWAVAGVEAVGVETAAGINSQYVKV